MDNHRVDGLAADRDRLHTHEVDVDVDVGARRIR